MELLELIVHGDFENCLRRFEKGCEGYLRDVRVRQSFLSRKQRWKLKDVAAAKRKKMKEARREQRRTGKP
jgi:ribosomal protein S21